MLVAFRARRMVVGTFVHGMTILADYPPNYDRICMAFPAVKGQLDVLFSYGEILYNPSGKVPPSWMLVHEEVHADRQLKMGVELWWMMYLSEPKFRLVEELYAYRAEYRAFKKIYLDPNEQARFLNFQADQLSGPNYGNLLSKGEAVRQIRL